MRQFALEHGDEDDSDDSDGNDGVSSSGRAKSGAFATPFHFPLSLSLSLSLTRRHHCHCFGTRWAMGDWGWGEKAVLVWS